MMAGVQLPLVAGHVSPHTHTHSEIAFLSSPKFYHWKVIQNEAMVCFRTMRAPLSGRLDCLECFIRLVPPHFLK
jgi:hypothetical protein